MQEEITELFALTDALCARIHTRQDEFRKLSLEMKTRLDAAVAPIELERLSETFGRALRHFWIEAAVSSTSRNYRSPPTTQKTRTATGRSIEFGYERDLQPTYLEERCRSFWGEPPDGWSSDHILLSSGQSAMAAVLHVLEGGLLIGGNRQLSFVHLGSYFETSEIFSLFSSLLKPIGCGRNAVETLSVQDADVFIIEPVFCDGEFGSVDVHRVIDLHRANDRPRIYIFDETLTGATNSLEGQLVRLRALNPRAVFRLISGLKLLQGGLELANVGVLTVFTPDDAAVSSKQLGDRIRKIRTLIGLGLSFADLAVLEAPWFLDRDYTDMYQRAIFDNNARLAKTVSANNRVFHGTFHPSVLQGLQSLQGLPQCRGSRDAPYCVFRLAENTAHSYARLEELLQDQIRERGILFESGGSFGFRGHRFEIVRPEDESEPFLRVALGRRTGWSCDQIITLMSEIASAHPL